MVGSWFRPVGQVYGDSLNLHLMNQIEIMTTINSGMCLLHSKLNIHSIPLIMTVFIYLALLYSFMHDLFLNLSTNNDLIISFNYRCGGMQSQFNLSGGKCGNYF